MAHGILGRHLQEELPREASMMTIIFFAGIGQRGSHPGRRPELRDLCPRRG